MTTHRQSTVRELRELYDSGVNITAHLKDELGEETNTREIIEISYDLQAGDYVSHMSDAGLADHKKRYGFEIAERIADLCLPESLLEVGVGEATTLAEVAAPLVAANEDLALTGFDLSWSRVLYARGWLASQGLAASLCTGDLFKMPYAADSVDVVTTNHSMEPNGGKEREILQELYRVTGRYLVLFEPAYEFASAEARQRMESHGYVRNLADHATALGYEVIVHEHFMDSGNPLNPTGLTVIKKHDAAPAKPPEFACPRTGKPLTEVGDMLYSEEAGAVYPVVAGIPCLRPSNAILATKYLEAFDATGALIDPESFLDSPG